MPNTAAVSKFERGAKMFQGAFSDMFLVTITISDQDAVTANDMSIWDLTVTGLALGDMVVGHSFTVDMEDGADPAMVDFNVSAANTLTMYLHADATAFDADALNGAVVKVLVGRPAW